MAPPLQPPVLSVIIVAYKSVHEIAACLGSIPESLDGRAVEVMVVDNHPHDGIEELIHTRYARVRYIPRPDNPGFGRANNAGYRETSGEVVLFLNPDTVCNAPALQHCVRRAQAERDLGLISPRLVMANGEMDVACRRSIPTLWDGFCRAVGLSSAFPRVAWFGGYNLTYLPVEGTYDVGAINGAFMMGRRELFEEVGVFDESFFMYGDDLDLCIRVRAAGWKIVYDGRVEITHLKGQSVAKDYDRMARAIFDANRDVYLKHFNPHKSLLVEWKYIVAFGAWKQISLLRARLRGSRRVRPA